MIGAVIIKMLHASITKPNANQTICMAINMVHQPISYFSTSPITNLEAPIPMYTEAKAWAENRIHIINPWIFIVA